MPFFRADFQHLYGVERHRIVMPKYTMRLNRGERPDPLPEELRREIRNKLSLKTLQQYPSYSEFYRQLSEHFDMSEKNICVGAGIEEFIRTLTFLCCAPGEEFMLVPWPSCAMFDIYAKAFNVKMRKITPAPGHKPSINDLIYTLERSDWRSRLVFLVNPGQPVETCYGLDEISVLAQALCKHDIILAVDEAHHGFGAPTALPLIKHYDNIVVLRTFSKFYSAASIRVGMAFGDEKVIKPLYAVRPSGEVTGYSMATASCLLEHQEQLEALATETARVRDWTLKCVNEKELGIKAYGRYGFSVLVEFLNQEGAEAVADGLAKRGILVKSRFPYPVQKCIMAACGNQQMMRQFCSELFIELYRFRGQVWPTEGSKSLVQDFELK